VNVLVLVDEDRWPGFFAAGAESGFVPRRRDTLSFAQQTRVLLVRQEPRGLDVDVVLGSLPFEKETVAWAVWVEASGVRVPLPRPEDLLIMKAVAHRPHDLADIEAILAVHLRLNLRRERRWVQEFSEALSMPEIFHDLETLLSQRRKRRK
jgi:predicted nucleotidyltransferase